MSIDKAQANKISHYYVDEAGDGTLFNRRGKVIIGTEGCSEYFIMGLLEVPNPAELSSKLEDLRKELLADPYFKQVPSMKSTHAKTALAFHAKDDVAEVRKEVFSLLRKQVRLKFFAVVKRKKAVLDYVLSRQKQDKIYSYQPNELYDLLVRRLFKDRLHKADEYNITFAQRGNSKRTKALKEALEIARQRSQVSARVNAKGLMNVNTMSAAQHSGLQAVDYFLWALQRLYERKEDRYLEYLWSMCSCVVDMDDIREHKYGVYYTQKKPLTVASLLAE
jgi:hypothetical protein